MEGIIKSAPSPETGFYLKKLFGEEEHRNLLNGISIIFPYPNDTESPNLSLGFYIKPEQTIDRGA
ncbi:hypothetical protein J4427_00615 [Candidatus Woesearchaeota archaeon]|nr:hypothetical protein [Candidatus Woesearchaeota archaeon]